VTLGEHKFRLIGSRFTAIIACCLTGALTAEEIRVLFVGAPHKADWLIPLDSLPPLPVWSVVAVNLFFYAYLLWLAFWFFRATEDKERIVVVGFFLSASLVILNPIRALSSAPVVTAIRILRATGIGTAFCASLSTLVEGPAFGRGDGRTALRLLLFVGGFVVFAFAVGVVLYFARP